MSNDYWFPILRERISRRRALIGTGTATAAVAFLTACGGDSNRNTGNRSSLNPFEDTSKQAKRGGTLKWFASQEPASFDVHLQHNPLVWFKAHHYENLVKETPGYLGPQDYKGVTPELATSWEWSPDKLQLTLKLRQGVKYHNKPPVNGRAFDHQDVLASWERFIRVGTLRSGYANAVNPNAPVLSLTAPDAQTIVMKLKEPTSWLESALGHQSTGHFGIIPKETDSTFDIRRDVIGTGPYVLSRYEPSVGMTFTRNQEYWQKDLPHADQVDAPFVLQYPTGLSQLKTGNIYTYPVNSEDVLITKQDVHELKMYQREEVAPTGGRVLAFGRLGPLFRDERVRQAVSLSWDRDLWLETFGNISKLEAEGLSVTTKWYSALGAGVFWWLDPKGKDFGPNAKYFQHDVAEAKKLLTAAGHPNGLDIDKSRRGTGFGERQSEVLDGMATEAGFRMTPHFMDTAIEYPKFRDGNGKWDDGWAYIVGAPISSDPVGFFIFRYSTKGSSFLGFDANGGGDGAGDPLVEDLITRANLEFDANRRQSLLFDLQRHLAKAMYAVPNPGVYSGFDLAWPVLRNFGVHQGSEATRNMTMWIDDTQPPLQKA